LLNLKKQDNAMTEKGFERKLAAILCADVEGYSRLMGGDEISTIRTLTKYKETMTALIKQHRGRVVDAPGDNLLAEFASVVNAVNCAVEIQQTIAERNEELPDKRKMQFRIGINLGDVIEEENRIYGDGVNIASRVESLCDGGGVCISGTAFEHVENKLDLKFKNLGEHNVKNIVKPVRVYRVIMVAESQESVMDETLELPAQPSIAVLPFRNLSGEPEQEFFSDGFTEDIINTLAKFPRMFVIARESSFTFKGRSVKIQDVGRDLGVRYVLEGSIQKFGDQVRITAQLIDATNGHHLWAEKYDRELKDIFAMRDEIILKIADALAVELTEGEHKEWIPETDKFEAHIKVMQSLELMRRQNPDDIILSRQKAKEALDLDPNYSPAMLMLAWTFVFDVVFGMSKTPEKSIEQACDLAQKVLERRDSDAGAHWLLGYAYLLKGQFDKAVSELETAHDLAPNVAEINAGLGLVLSRAGKPEEAINVLKKAIRLNPFPPGWYLSRLGDAYRQLEQYEKAVHEYNKAIQQQPDDMFSHLNLAVCYVELGWKEDAQAEVAEVLRINPKFSVENYAKHNPSKDEASQKSFIESMRKVGLPE
jgi:adenylate cyclase